MPNFHRKRCVFGCTTIGVSVHDFPNPDKFPLHYKRWVEIAGKPLKNLTQHDIYRKKKICNIHFTENDWNRNNRLNALAVPSQYLPDGGNIVMHLFPNPDNHMERHNKWKEAIGGDIVSLDAHYVFRHRRICHLHFEARYHTHSKRLSAIAVPTLQLPGHKDSNSTKVEDVNLKSKESRIQRDFLSDHTYSLFGYSKYGKKKDGETATKDNKIDLNTRVDTDVNVTINYPCHNKLGYNYEDEDNDDYDFDEDAVLNATDDNFAPNTPQDDAAPTTSDGVQNTSVIEVEVLPQDLFSWEKTDVIVADDTEVIPDGTADAPEVTLDLGDVSLYNDNDGQPTKNDDTGGEFAEYRCNECGNIIKGFRYTCVQCADWDLCAACEARAAHDAHYVLRVPRERPYKEMQAVLAAIRHQMMSEDLFLPETIAKIKAELKDEDPETLNVEADPLEAWDVCQHDNHSDATDAIEIQLERKDKNASPSRKRRRTSLYSLDNIQDSTPHANGDSSYNDLETVSDDDHMESKTDCDTFSNVDYSEPIEIIDIDKLIKTQEQTGNSKENDNDTLERSNEFCTEMPLRRCASHLDTFKSIQHNKHESLVDVNISSDKTLMKTIKLTSEIKDDTHRIAKHSKEMETCSKGIETRDEARVRKTEETRPHCYLTEALQTKEGTDSEVIGSRGILKTSDKTKKRYKIMLPPGAQWKQVLMTMLKSRVTVPIEDVMRKE